MTGLYSEAHENSSSDLPQETESLPRLAVAPGKYDSEQALSLTVSTTLGNPAVVTTSISAQSHQEFADKISCHSRQPSASLVDREKTQPYEYIVSDEQLNDCGIFNCRPVKMQKFARIKTFVLLLSMLVTLQQALSSGYINSVITTIEKRFDIPSSLSGLIASSYEIGNVITVIFVSYLGSRRHIPCWIGIGMDSHHF